VSAALALAWCARLAAVSVALQTFELWQVRSVCADAGVWSWPVLREEHRALPAALRWLFAVLLPYRCYLALLALRAPLLLALGLGWLPAAALLLLTQLAIGARFRGTFNGGSDYMTVTLLLGLTAASVGHPLAARAGLAYVCVQLVLSYFIAGVVKLAQPGWRSGLALQQLLSSNRYGTPPGLRRVVRRAGVARWLSIALLGFECGFPLALTGPRAALAFVVCGVAFHLGTVVAFGLNRFLFAWAAAYPALFYFSSQLG
jgi:hypothetical protein